MVTSHLGRPTEGEFEPADSLAPVARAAVRAARARRCRSMRDWVDGGRGVEARAGEVVLLENCRFNKGEKKDDDALARKMAALCDVYVQRRVRHRAPRRGDDPRHREVRAGRLRRAAAGRRARRAGHGARASEAPAGRDRRRLEGVDQAHDPEGARREGRPADRRRRHRQHVHARGAACTIGKSLAEPTSSARRRRSSTHASRRKVPIPVDVVVRQGVLGDRDARRSKARRGRRAPTT